MTKPVFNETFNTPTLNSQLTWFNEPQEWQLENDKLVIKPDAKTDFWQKTHYGFQVDNGHCLLTQVDGDFSLSTRVQFHPAHQYDQAGLMVRLSADCWLKTSVEYEPDGPNKLGVVVTNHGYSDWSTQDFTADHNQVTLRVNRTGNDYLVEYLTETGWSQMRMAHLHATPDQHSVECGLYACSPIDAGYTAEFDFLKLEPITK